MLKRFNSFVDGEKHVGHDKKKLVGCWWFSRDYTTQFCGWFRFTIKRIPIKQPVQWKVRGVFCWGWFRKIGPQVLGWFPEVCDKSLSTWMIPKYLANPLSWRILPVSKWFITMVIVSPLRIRLFLFQMAFSWLITGVDPKHWTVRFGMIADDPPSGTAFGSSKLMECFNSSRWQWK